MRERSTRLAELPLCLFNALLTEENQAFQTKGPFHYVIHTASPYKLRWDDPVKDCLDPAIKGTTGLLAAVHAHAPTVRRVVITSSSAAMLNLPKHLPIYDESCWANVTWEQAVNDQEHTYRGSKVRVTDHEPAL